MRVSMKTSCLLLRKVTLTAYVIVGNMFTHVQFGDKI